MKSTYLNLLGLLGCAFMTGCWQQQGVAQNPFDLNKDGQISTKTMNPSKMGIRMPDGTTIATDGLGQNSFGHMRIEFDVQTGDPIYVLDSTNSNGPSNQFQLPIGNPKNGNLFQGRTASGQKFKIAKYSVDAKGVTSVQGFEWSVDPVGAIKGFQGLVTAMAPSWDKMTSAQKAAYLAQLQRDKALGNTVASAMLDAFKVYMGVP